MSPSDFDFSQYKDSAPDSSSTLSFDTGDSADATGGGFFGDTEAPTWTLAAAGPPYSWLLAEIGMATAGVVFALIGGRAIFLSILAWALAGPAAIVLAAGFVFQDNKQRAKPLYGEQKVAVVLHRAGLGIALIGVVVASLNIAGWAGRT